MGSDLYEALFSSGVKYEAITKLVEDEVHLNVSIVFDVMVWIRIAEDFCELRCGANSFTSEWCEWGKDTEILTQQFNV